MANNGSNVNLSVKSLLCCQTVKPIPYNRPSVEEFDMSLVVASPATNVETYLEEETVIIEKTFPTKLYRFLNEVDQYNISHIASWQPNGDSFRIHKPAEFLAIKEPRWFVHKKYSSMQRQLNIYGFRRITNGPDKNGYWHPNFIRGRDDLLPLVHRVPVKMNALSNSFTTLSSEPEYNSSTSLYDSDRTSRATTERKASRYRIKHSNTNTTRMEGHNNMTTNQSNNAINHVNHPISQTDINDAVRVLENHDGNQAATTLTNSMSAALFQRYSNHRPVSTSTGNRSYTSINEIHPYHLHHLTNNSQISGSARSPINHDLAALLLRREGGGPAISLLVLRQHLLSLAMMNNMPQQSHDLLLAAQTATRPADQVYLNLCNDNTSLIPTDQNLRQRQLQSMRSSAIDLTLLQGNQFTSQTVRHAHVPSSSSALSRCDNAPHRNDDQHQIVLGDDNQSRVDLPRTVAVAATPINDGNIIRIDRNIRIDDNEKLQRNHTLVDADITRQQQQQQHHDPASSTPNELLMIANVLARYQSSS